MGAEWRFRLGTVVGIVLLLGPSCKMNMQEGPTTLAVEDERLCGFPVVDDDGCVVGRKAVLYVRRSVMFRCGFRSE